MKLVDLIALPRWTTGMFCAGVAGLLLAAAAPVQANRDATGREWYAHNSHAKGEITTISTASGYVVAATRGGQLLEFKGGGWQMIPGFEAFRESGPFGEGTETNLLRAAVTSDGTVWFGAHLAQGNDARYLEGKFEVIPRGTVARTMSISSYGGTVVIGHNNGRISIVKHTTRETPARSVTTLPDHGNSSVWAVGGSSSRNVWASLGSRVFQTTSGDSSKVNWIEHLLPASGVGTVRAISVPDDSSAYFGVTREDVSHLLVWRDGAFGATPLWSFQNEAFFTITGVYAQDSTNVWVAGTNGNLWHFDGSKAQKIDLGLNATLTAISGDEHGIWVGAANGEIFSTVRP